MRRQVVVVSGGASSEHDVSVASGRDVASTLAADDRYSVIEAHVDRVGAWHVGSSTASPQSFADVLDEITPETVVFPVLHGGWGEGGGLQGELEARGIPFVGSGSDAAGQALSKRATLRSCAGAGVRVVPTWWIDRRAYCADPDLVARSVRRSFDGDLVVKPDTGGSSIGVGIVSRGRPLQEAFAGAFAEARVALVQPLVLGQEVSVGVWANKRGVACATGASLLRMPRGAADGGFTYAHKYEGAGAVLEIPAAFPDAVLDGLRAAALRCFAALGCRGMARIDFFVDGEGRILLNEINTIPGLRRESHFPRLVAAAGTSYAALLDDLVEEALRTARGQSHPHGTRAASRVGSGCWLPSANRRASNSGAERAGA